MNNEFKKTIVQPKLVVLDNGTHKVASVDLAMQNKPKNYQFNFRDFVSIDDKFKLPELRLLSAFYMGDKSYLDMDTKSSLITSLSLTVNVINMLAFDYAKARGIPYYGLEIVRTQAPEFPNFEFSKFFENSDMEPVLLRSDETKRDSSAPKYVLFQDKHIEEPVIKDKSQFNLSMDTMSSRYRYTKKFTLHPTVQLYVPVD